jgi:ribonucleoside-diphosphate reductase alpha chain
MSVFRNKFSEDIFNYKYRHEGCETWEKLSDVIVDDVCRDKMTKEEKSLLKKAIREMKFLPGGRYIYYAGREIKAFNNCYLLRAESDTREDWAMLSWKAESCLSTGGGIGVDYSIYRPKDTPLKRTGGQASGPVSKMRMINEIGREVMQGGSRRSAIYASLNWQHQDIQQFLYSKDWFNMKVPGTDKTFWDCKVADFNFAAPLDMTNISANYDDAWLNTPDRHKHPTFLANCRQAMMTGEPGWSFNFGDKQNETLRNACTEVTSEDDSDVCNLGSLNMSRIESKEEFQMIIRLATKFLICGTLVADLPYAKVHQTREKNRRLGLGLMGMHEWLVQRGYRYEVTPELHEWLAVYRDESDYVSRQFSAQLSISEPVAKRAIAPTGSIGILAGTTTGIEPVFAVAYKRRYLKNGTQWHYQYVVDSAAKDLIERYGISPDRIESAIDLAKDYERRLKFQADTQDYVDQSISSTINMPSWGSPLNNEDKVADVAETLSRYAPRLRGFTVYPDGARGGQPLVSVDYAEAARQQGVEYLEHDICAIGGKGGTCGS